MPEYKPGRGHPIGVDNVKNDKNILTYSDELHGKMFYIMCSKPFWNCHNDEVLVKDYASHLRNIHHREIDPVQERLMKASCIHGLKIQKWRQGKYVWAPFKEEIPPALYEMHMWAIARELADKGKENG